MTDVGRILCEDANGLPQFTVYYAVPTSIRLPEIFTEKGIYFQNHQEPTRRWVYRYMRPLGDRPTDSELCEYRYPTDINWDGGVRDATPVSYVRGGSEDTPARALVLGRIMCENTNGKPQFTVHYAMPSLLRSPELFTKHGVYYQNHQTATGQWVYRYVHPLNDRSVNLDLSAYRYPNDEDWDGGQFARPLATWPLVSAQFEALLAQRDCPSGVQALFSLARAAFHRLPIPEDLDVMIPTIPFV